MKNFFFNICFFLDSSRKEKCSEFLNEISNVIYYIINSKLFIIILVLFLIILISLIFQKNNKQNRIFLLPFLIFLTFFFILINFNTNLPWVDDWEYIENLQTEEIGILNWLFQPTNIHNIFFLKVIFLLNNNFFNLDFSLFNYLSIILIFLIALFFTKNESIDNKIYLSLFIVLIFSGKQFANFSQASNLSWTICFFYVILFNYFLKSNHLIKIIICSLIIFIAPLTFGLGYVLPLFILFFIYFFELNFKIKISYVLFSLSGILISVFIPKILFQDLQSIDLGFSILQSFTEYKFYLTFFGVLSNVFLPWIEGFAYLGVLIGFIQILSILIIFLKNYKKFGFNYFKNFIVNNILIIMGLIFAFIVSLTRPDLQTIVAARYSVGSIIFQIGYWLFILKNNKINFINSFNFIKILTIYLFLSGLLFPYNGIHWQANRSILNKSVIDCYKNDPESKTNNCDRLAYKTLFYEGEWYQYENFKEQLKILKENKKSFFNF